MAIIQEVPDEGYNYEFDEDEECSEDSGAGEPGDYRFEVLTAEQILQHMVECIREVNDVIQVVQYAP
ncbi:unnamed protein product [Coregonus sp. 'balchen']|nr:unnamed protein product [Coregonus sp. 'balchen']